MGLFDRFRSARAAGAAAEPPRSDGPKGPPEGVCRRRAPRIETSVLSCLIGPIKDVSVSGMRVVAPAVPPVPPGAQFEFEIESPTDSLTVVGKIARIQKLRSAGYELGIEFQRVTAAQAEALDQLARTGKIRARKSAPAASSSPEPAARVNIPDLYAVLGVAADCTMPEVQRAYRDLARKYHPDVNKTEEAAAKIIELNRAYEILSDSDKRRAYDEAWASGRAAA